MNVALRVTAGAALLSTVAFAQPSYAFEPTNNPVADAFLKALEGSDGTSVSYGGSSSAGKDVTFTDLKVAFENDEGKGTVTIGTAELVNGALGADDVLTADAINLDSFKLTEEESQAELTFATGTITNPTIPTEFGGDDAASQVAEVADYDKAEFEGLVFTDENGSGLPISKVMLEVTKRIDGKPRGGVLAVDDLVIKADAIDDPDTKQRLSELGYDEIVLDLDGSGDWNSDDGTLTLDTFKIDAKDMGSLTVTGQFMGFTPAVLAKLQANNSDLNQLMQALQDASIGVISVRFDDASITSKALDYTAKEQDQSRSELVDEMVGQVNGLLAMLDNASFQKQVTDAVSTFLNDPQSLEIAAKPANPVPVPQVVGTVMMSPQTLPSVLSVAVTANEPASEEATSGDQQ
ncbi:hypothetical protein [Amorphus sp. 3PC139-8]|uniref:hypothetical protein n=1 Tax=Amorphus sp. 3PC139-8 TaxID=2735676 RepID=UPI00345DACBF